MRQTANNTFSDGLNLDLHPIVTPNTVLTDNLNGTFITYNGNEFCLQNDNGNIEKATLPDNFIPIGAKEYNGIIYIVSCNKNNGLNQIGTYPGVNWDVNKGTLNYSQYTPIRNLYDIDPTNTIDFEGNFGYDTKHPITIEIQPSYDGSVNLIIIDNKNKPRIINSGFSVLPDNKYEIITRNQTNKTNLYKKSDFNESTNLIRTNNILTNIDLVSVESGGQLKGGNYTFYIKFGDSDYNKTDVIAESGIVSIFKGNEGIPSTVSGTLLDERTDKKVKLKIRGLNPIYSKLYIYFTREYSDTNGFRMTESGMLVNPIDIKDERSKFEIENDLESYQSIWITGFEQQVAINTEELNVDYHTIDSARAETQHSNMLFLGNITNAETFELYEMLKAYSGKISAYAVQPRQDSENLPILPIDATTYTGGLEYYSTQNIYYKLGYWPEEIYRFGIVYILKDNSTTPVFPLSGLLDGFDGVYKIPNMQIIQEDGIYPIGIKFNLPEITESLINENVIGAFFVRQKRIPNTICQGLSGVVDNISHTPMIRDNNANWITQSFLSSEDGRPWNGGITEKKSPTLKYENMSGYSESGFEKWLATHTKRGIIDSYYCKSNSSFSLGGQPNDIRLIISTINNKIGSDFTETDVLYSDNETRDFFDTHNSGELKTIYVVIYKQYDKSDEFTGVYKFIVSLNEYFYNTDWERASNILGKDVYFSSTPNRNSNIIAVSKKDYIDSLEKRSTERIISNKENVNGKYTYYSSDALFSLDPCLVSSVKDMLDGSNFYFKKYLNIKDNKSTKLGNVYSYNVSNYNSQTEGFTSRGVFVDSNTAIKVVDDKAFSTVAGDASDVSRYSPLSTAYAVGTDQSDIDDPTSEVYVKATRNINLIRGNFTPFVGLTSEQFTKDSNNFGVYSIKLKQELNDSDNLVRAQDNSEFYCISERFYLKDTKNIIVYRGDCYTNTISIRLIRNFIDPNVPISENILDKYTWWNNVVEGHYFPGQPGWTSGKDPKFEEVNLADVNTVDLGLWITFKCLSSYNLGLRSVDSFHTDEMAMFGSPRSFYPLNGASTSTGNKLEESYLLNDGLSATVGRKRYNKYPNDPYTKSEFSNRIMFSNVNITDSFTNGYRTFQGLSYKDYDKQYGAITKLISLGQNIFIVMEHGLGLVPVNPKALMQTTTGEAIHIYGYGVLPDEMTIISQDFGSKYEHSVVRTPIGIYGVDTDAKKIWRFSDKNGFETISDMKIESYLNDNLFTNKEVNIELCDVRTHYNSFKGDLMFSFYSKESEKPDYYLYIDDSDVDLVENDVKAIPYESNIDDKDIVLKFDNHVFCFLKENKLWIIAKQDGNTYVEINGIRINLNISKYVNPTPIPPVDPIEIPVDIKLSKQSINVREIDPTQYVDVTINKTDITLDDLDIVNSDTYTCSVLKIDGKLAINPLHPGSSIITVSYNNTSSKIYVNITKYELTLDKEYVSLYIDDENTVSISDYTGSVSISCNNNNISAVLNNDIITITANSEGESIITVSDNKTTKTIEVEVVQYVVLEDIQFSEDISQTINLKVGESWTCNWEPIPRNYSKDKYSILFGSDNTSLLRTTINRDYNDYLNRKPYIVLDAIKAGETTATMQITDWNGYNKNYVLNIIITDE